MHKKMSLCYVTPVIEVVMVEVEAGFAATEESGKLNFGNDGFAGGGIGPDDINWGGDY